MAARQHQLADVLHQAAHEDHLGVGSTRGLRDQLAGGGLYASDAVRLFLGAKVMLSLALGSATYGALVFMHRPHIAPFFWVMR